MVRVFRNNNYQNISLQEYLDIYHSNLLKDWEDFYFYVKKAFDVDDEESIKVFLLEMNLRKFDFILMKKKYDFLKFNEKMSVFDDDILRFISFLYGFGYFERIGNPDLIQWLNSKNLTPPSDEQSDYSLLEVNKLRNGGNAVRHKLLTTLSW